MKNGSFLLAVVLSVGLLSQMANGADVVPSCLSQGHPIPVNNQQVLTWKQTLPPTVKARAHVSGTVIQPYPDRNGHLHFEIKIGPAPTDVLEIIYNEEFGNVPTPQVGMTVEACGDYITSKVATAQYPASPAGAILHWVHMSPDKAKHDDGFLEMNGTVCGLTEPLNQTH